MCVCVCVCVWGGYVANGSEQHMGFIVDIERSHGPIQPKDLTCTIMICSLCVCVCVCVCLCGRGVLTGPSSFRRTNFSFKPSRSEDILRLRFR